MGVEPGEEGEGFVGVDLFEGGEEAAFVLGFQEEGEGFGEILPAGVAGRWVDGFLR